MKYLFLYLTYVGKYYYKFDRRQLPNDNNGKVANAVKNCFILLPEAIVSAEEVWSEGGTEGLNNVKMGVGMTRTSGGGV